MSTIRFCQPYHIPKQQALSAAEAIAKALQNKLNLTYHWQGDELRFKRTGANGSICIAEDEVRFELNLGLLLRPLKSTIEKEVQNYFAKYFG